MFKSTITLCGETYTNVTATINSYADLTTALQLWIEGELLTVASTNLGAYDLWPSTGCIFVKNYSEGEGLAQQLEDQGIATKTGLVVSWGNFGCTATEMRLN